VVGLFCSCVVMCKVEILNFQEGLFIIFYQLNPNLSSWVDTIITGAKLSKTQMTND